MRILLAAIAKNESAYLPEWIYHNLAIGVEQILVYVNRTTDNSREIIDRIGQRQPVSYIEADGLDVDREGDLSSLIHPRFEQNNPLQSRAFARAYQYAVADGFDYVAFFDIDEYLHIENGLSLSQLVVSAGLPSILKFKWFTMGFEEQSFGPAFTRLAEGAQTGQCKYILSTRLNGFLFKSTHHVLFPRSTSIHSWIAGVSSWDSLVHHRSVRAWCDTAFILHRARRSKAEFLALVGRGDAVKQNEFCGFKLSRLKPPKSGHIITFPEAQVSRYANGLKSFIHANCLKESIERAQACVNEQALDAKRRYLSLPQKILQLSDGLSHHGLPRYQLEINLAEQGQGVNPVQTAKNV